MFQFDTRNMKTPGEVAYSEQPDTAGPADMSGNEGAVPMLS
jgi:hypothetical protein